MAMPERATPLGINSVQHRGEAKLQIKELMMLGGLSIGCTHLASCLLVLFKFTDSALSAAALVQDHAVHPPEEAQPELC